MPIADALLHVAMVVALPPALLGVIARVKAVAAGRRGPPLLQPYFDLWKLVRKGTVTSRTTTAPFRAGPVVGLAATALAAAIVPLGHAGALVGFPGDVVALVYLFALARFFTVLAALDTGSSFEGMGAARDAAWACLAEPALFLGLLAGVRLSDASSLSVMLGSGMPVPWEASGAPLALVVVSLFLVLLVENARIPFDDPNTHLELTMVHEVMVLDHSGPALGMIHYAAALKLFVFGALVVRLVVPFHGTALVDWPAFAAAMLALVALVGLVESSTPRLALARVPRLLVSACLLSAFGLLLVSR